MMLQRENSSSFGKSMLSHLRKMIQAYLLKIISHHLEMPILIDQITQNLISSGQLNWRNHDELRRYFFQQMQLCKGLSGLQWGSEEGDYVGILDLGNRTPTLEIKQSNLSNHKYAFSLDLQGNPSQICLGCAYDYDPRIRPWYCHAVQSDRLTWSSVYQYSSNASVQLGVMAALPVLDTNQNLLGVVGCDVALTHLSQVLKDASEHLLGIHFLVERDGQIIASSIHDRPFQIEAGKALRFTSKTCDFLPLEYLVKQLEQENIDFSSIHCPLHYNCLIHDLEYVIDIQPINVDLGLDWLLISILPQTSLADLNQNISDYQWRDTFISLQQANQNLQEQVRRSAVALTKSNQALKASEERWLLALQGTNDGIWDWHIDTHEVFFSDRWLEIIGYQHGELAFHIEEWKQRIHPEDRQRVMAAIQDHFEKRTDFYVIEYRTRCKDGTYKWVLDRGQALWDKNNRPIRMVGSRSDITERKKMESRLIYQAEHDALTSLLNRSALLKSLGSLLAFSDRNFYLIFIDIDRFKSINDSLGHRTGDRLLVDFAQRLQRLVRPNDQVARLSGDEFVILLFTNREEIDIDNLINRIKGSLQQAALNLNLYTPFSASIGITSRGHSRGNPHDYLRDADIAMHAAKQAGGNRYVIFHEDLRKASLRKLEIERLLKVAIAHQSLKVYFQPIVCLKTLKPTSIEALIRWHDPKLGWVSPSEFIPVAEKSDLIIEIGNWILSESCQHLKQWHHRYSKFRDLRLNINVSVKQFYQADFIQTLDRVLEVYQVPPQCLQLEITESCFIEKSEIAIQMMQGIRERQIHLCIDDFGTGYSSLSYLHQLPVSSLKIDQSFVARVADNEPGTAMVKAILAMGNSLNIKVVAEGIETQLQCNKLQQMGCRYGQGYLFAKPVDVDGMDQWLRIRHA